MRVLCITSEKRQKAQITNSSPVVHAQLHHRGSKWEERPKENIAKNYQILGSLSGGHGVLEK
jgi:hypothetical protein